MAVIPIPRVTGFAVAGSDEDPIVCVHVEAGELGVWIGRRWPGAEVEIVDHGEPMVEITVGEAHRILAAWPAVQDASGDALQFAAWHGRRMLTAQRLHDRLQA